eukprot:1996279-Pleurochrysis_carterae.AAC.1
MRRRRREKRGNELEKGARRVAEAEGRGATAEPVGMHTAEASVHHTDGAAARHTQLRTSRNSTQLRISRASTRRSFPK